MPETYFGLAEDAEQIGKNLIADEAEFEHLRTRHLIFVGCEPAPKKNGRAAFATAEIVRGKNAYLYWNAQGKQSSAPFYRVTVSTDLWSHLDAKQKAFVIRHELRHCQVKAQKKVGVKPTIKPHDVEIFLADLSDPCMDSVCRIWQKVKEASPPSLFDEETGEIKESVG